jgi:hypothetical protein
MQDAETRRLDGITNRAGEPAEARGGLPPAISGGDEPPMPGLEQGSVIADRYKILSEVPGGGEGDIYICRDSVSGRDLVVKVYRLDMQPTEDVLRRVAEIKHEHVVSIVDHGRWRNRYYEAMEYAEGGTLAAAAPFTEKEIEQKLLPQLLGALRFLHDHGIVHRDFKPSNMYFRDRQKTQVVIGDLGISSVLKDGQTRRRTTHVKGTYEYSAPEIWSRTGEYGKEADYYSLGMSLLYLLKGETPFDGMGPEAIITVHQTGEVPLPGDLSPRFWQLVMGLLLENLRQRWGLEQVAAWLKGDDVAVVHEPPRRAFSYKLDDGLESKSLQELGQMLMAHPDLAARHIKTRILADQLRKFDPVLAAKVLDIVDRSHDIAAAVQGVAYQLDTQLSYQLTPELSAATPADLVRLIDRNRETWEAGKNRIKDQTMFFWLMGKGYWEYVTKWNEQAKQFSNTSPDVLLESFLEGLASLCECERTRPRARLHSGSVRMLLQTGQTRQVTLRVANSGSGYLYGAVEMASEAPGVELSTSVVGTLSGGGPSEVRLSVAPAGAGIRRAHLRLTTNGDPQVADVPVTVFPVPPASVLSVLIGAAAGLLGYVFYLFRYLEPYASALAMTYGVGLLYLGLAGVLAGGLCGMAADRRRYGPRYLVPDMLLGFFTAAAVMLSIGGRAGMPGNIVLSSGLPAWIYPSFWAGLALLGLARRAPFGGVVSTIMLSYASTWALLYYRMWWWRFAMMDNFPMIAASLIKVFPAVIVAAVGAWFGQRWLEGRATRRRSLVPMAELMHRVLALALVIAVTAMAGLQFAQARKGAAAPAESKPEVVETTGKLTFDGNSTVYEVEAGELVVNVTLLDRCWVRITSDGSLLTEGTYGGGQQWDIKASGEVRIRFGNPAANILVNGQTLEGWAPQHDVTTLIVRVKGKS